MVVVAKRVWRGREDGDAAALRLWRGRDVAHHSHRRLAIGRGRALPGKVRCLQLLKVEETDGSISIRRLGQDTAVFPRACARASSTGCAILGLVFQREGKEWSREWGRRGGGAGASARRAAATKAVPGASHGGCQHSTVPFREARLSSCGTPCRAPRQSQIAAAWQAAQQQRKGAR